MQRFFIALTLLSQLVAPYPDVPALDITPTEGDSPPIVNVKLGYPREHSMKMALDLNYETSWLFATRKCHSLKCAQQCYQTGQSETLTNHTIKQQRRDSKWNFYGQDLVTLRNGREYQMKFGFTEATCPNKYRPYSGVLSLAPQNTQFAFQFLSQFKNLVVSFFLPSARSRMQKGTMVFGTAKHPGCTYNNGVVKVVKFTKDDRWRFQASKVNVRSTGTGTYSDGLYQDMYLASDVEGLIVPEHYAKKIYDSFNVTTSETDPDLYQTECYEIEQRNDYIDFYFGGIRYHLEAKYLFTPINEQLCKLNVRIGDSSTKDWVLGKQFMERFCVTINYRESTLQFGLVSQKQQP